MSIRVVARLRPLQKHEAGREVIVSAHRNGDAQVDARPNVVKVPNPKNESESYAFQFTSVYDDQASQQDIYDSEIAPTIKSLFNGLDVTIFAYGSTGTGKTHTMRGGKSLADRGIIPRLLSGIYRRARKIDKDSEGKTEVDITLSYYEIYNDKVYDLFEAPEARTAIGLPIRDNGGKSIVVGLTEQPCATLRDFEKLYDHANINRSTGATKLNAASSRSHAILAIRVAITSGDQVVISTASAIDLAGSEDNRRTGNGKERMVESAAINRSLFTLAKCVEAISQNQPRIPYRESKMTRILSLGQNNGLTIMILNLAPTRSYQLDTLSSLNFANRTKKIEVREIENEPMFKGSAPTIPQARGDAMKRQPLRPLTSASHNTVANGPRDPPKQGLKPKAFSVYSDRGRLSGDRGREPGAFSNGPSRTLKPSSLTTLNTSKRGSDSSHTTVDRSLLSKQAIEDLIERKVADALAARTFEQPSTTNEPEISQEVQRRLDMIERKIEEHDGSGREEGLSFLLCAKQHAVRGEHRSALKMYELAKEYFPNNAKLASKIEKLQAKLQCVKRSVDEIDVRYESDAHPQKKVRVTSKENQDDSDYHEDRARSDDESEEDRIITTKKHRQRLPGSLAHSEASGGLSPGSKQLIDIICSRDPVQISRLRGVGPKRAENIVEALNQEHFESIDSLARLARLKGVGVKTVENMRAGLQIV